jgi:hypothetical protein
VKCVDCPHFKILYAPIGKEPDNIWDFGRAKCEKHDLCVDFASKRKLNKLKCWEEEHGLDKPESGNSKYRRKD